MHPIHDAAAPATAPRHNMYGLIHKALRAFMSDTLVRIGRMDAGDASDLDGALAQLHELLGMCRLHLDDENRFVHPALEARAPGTSERIAGEHAHHEAEIDALGELADALERTRDEPAGRERAASHLYRRLAVFVGANFEHMEYEEHAHNATLWAHYTDDELRGIEAALHASLPPAALALGMRWILPSISHGERMGLLGGMRAHAPPAAFDAALALARTRLTERDWYKLERGVRPAGMPA